jgi:hypothetical protein
MRNWWRGIRNRQLDEKKLQLKREAREKIGRLLEVGGHEGEGEFVEAYKKLRPDATKQELLEVIMQFHDSVDEKKRHDLGLH